KVLQYATHTDCDSGLPETLGKVAPSTKAWDRWFTGKFLNNLTHKPPTKAKMPSNQEELFNLHHSSLWNVIERAFGILKHQFHILGHAPEYRLEQKYDIIIPCVCIHNSNIPCNRNLQKIFSQAKKGFSKSNLMRDNIDKG
ncbi:uncharacterized protein VP01_2299g2, partial [Puccinia sorghi]